MGKHYSVVLDDDLMSFVEAQISVGQFRTVDEAIVAGLKLLEENEAKVKALEEALIEGENSGDPTEFDFDAFLDAKEREPLF